MVNKIVRADGITEITDFKSFIYVESTNADDDLRPGGVYSARVEFEAYGAKTDAPSSGERLAYYQVFPDETETLIGYFYAEPVVATKATFQVAAYDAAKKLDTDFSKRLKSIQSSFPMTLSALVNQACDVAGVTVSGTIPQSTWSVGAFYADNITCRQILGWAAEIACRYVRCNTSGSLAFDWYTSKSGYLVYPSAGTSSNNETYIPYKQDGLQYENYTVTKVGAVAVQPPQMSGTAYVYPSSATDASNTLVIADNLLLTDNTDSTCTTLAQYIYNQMRSLPTYRPCTISTFPNESPLRAGDMVSVTDIQGVSFTTIVTDFSATTGVFKYGSKGNETYSKTYYNSVSRSASQSANSVTRAELVMTQDSIISTVTADTESKISQFANSISLSVSNSGTISTITLSGNGITTQSKNIQFTGYVTFNNLSAAGETTINGGNITTGTIQDANGNVVLDLTNGTLTMKNGAIYLGTPTNNVYPFQVTSDGVLTAKSGTVGGFTISDSSIYSGASSSTAAGAIYLSNNDFTRSIGGTSRSALRFAIGSTFGVDRDGWLYATHAVISGDITATSLTLGSGVTLAASKVSGLADVATSGSYSDLSGTPTIPDVTNYIQKDGTIGSTPADGATGFVVSSAGLLKASNAIIYGTIYASAGTIGGWMINGNYGIYTNSKTTATSTRSGILIQKDGGIYAGAYNSSTGACPFQVTSTGALTASSATITGTIRATAGYLDSINLYGKLSVYSSSSASSSSGTLGYVTSYGQSDGIGLRATSSSVICTSNITEIYGGTGWINVQNGVALSSLDVIGTSSFSGNVTIGTSSTSLTLKVNNKNVLTSGDLSGYVPTTRTVNGKALSSNITLSASDVSALSSSALDVMTTQGTSSSAIQVSWITAYKSGNVVTVNVNNTGITFSSSGWQVLGYVSITYAPPKAIYFYGYGGNFYITTSGTIYFYASAASTNYTPKFNMSYVKS